MVMGRTGDDFGRATIYEYDCDGKRCYDERNGWSTIDEIIITSSRTYRKFVDGFSAVYVGLSERWGNRDGVVGVVDILY